MEKKELTREQLIQAQRDYCERTKAPFFAPNNGICWHCGADMVSDAWVDHLFTGCNKCNRSYCD